LAFTIEKPEIPDLGRRKPPFFIWNDPDHRHERAANWGVIASLIETCKLNAVDPHAYLTDTHTAIVSGHKQSQINDLLPWNYNK